MSALRGNSNTTHASEVVDKAPEVGKIVHRRRQHHTQVVRHADVEKVEEKIALQ